MSRRSARLGAGVAVLVLLAGCGGSSAPSDAVPALGTSLERVDDAIVEGRYDDARSELDELVANTTAARDDGDLEGAEADRILAAAAQVMSALPAEPAEEAEDPPPAEEPSPTEEASPTETEAPSPAPEESPSEGDSEEEEEQEKLEEELEKEEEKAEKEAEKEEGSDNGKSSENGPDDGEGN